MRRMIKDLFRVMWGLWYLWYLLGHLEALPTSEQLERAGVEPADHRHPPLGLFHQWGDHHRHGDHGRSV
ncbi:MAG TPA: hypothetical protein VFC03_20420 [Acidimicrobiales bacterium]|nr:hypothetical protein [Acidimicrobiales bacterium]